MEANGTRTRTKVLRTTGAAAVAAAAAAVAALSIGTASASARASFFAVSRQYSCLANQNVNAFLRANHANVLRLILSPQQAPAGEGIGCVRAAHAAGFKVYISFQFANGWKPSQVASYFKRVLPAYAPFAWAVGIGNEQDLTSKNRNAQGTSSLSSRGRTMGQNYRADWNAAEPVLVKLAPHAIRVYGEFSPWRFTAIKQGFAAGRPPGVQAIAAHCYHTKRAGGLEQIPQNAAWARSKRLPLWCSEMGPAIRKPTTPTWAVPDTWASWKAMVARVRAKSPNLQVTSYYYWPTF
jgi:hypothetical protein